MMVKKLKYVNNWEADEYYVDGKLLTNLTKVMIGGKEYPVTRKMVSVPYHDMGHVYEGTSYHYFISEQMFGTKMTVDLRELAEKKVKMFAVEYSCKKES